MPYRLTDLAAAWRRLWARESLPTAIPGPDRSGDPARRSMLRALLAREQLPNLPGAAPGACPSLLSFILAPERLPAPGAVNPQAETE